MKTCTVLWYGTSKSGNHYISVEYFESDFAVSKFIKVTGNVEYTKGQEVIIPESALK